MDKFGGKYRISTTRLRCWDYSSKGMYFVTVCTANRIHYLGKITKPPSPAIPPAIQLSEIGRITEMEWLKTPDIRPDMNLSLDEFQIMPDHFHAILLIGDNPYNSRPGILESDQVEMDNNNYCPDFQETMPRTANNPRWEWEPDWNTVGQNKNKFAPQSNNLASIMRGFKSAVTTYARKHNIPFCWQPRFHDHIIRNYDEYLHIKKYIQNNTANWIIDKTVL